MKGKLAIIAAAVLIGTAGTYILNENTVERDTVEIQQEIAQKILRFHVLANSDSEEDQALKLKVRPARSYCSIFSVSSACSLS